MNARNKHRAGVVWLATTWCMASCSPAPSSDLGPTVADAGSPTAAIDAAEENADRAEADSLLGKDRDATLSELVKGIGGIQVVSTAGLGRLGLTWDQALEPTRVRFRAAKTAKDAYYALLSLQRSYHDSHSYLEVQGVVEQPKEPPVFLPLQVDVEYAADGKSHRYVVTRASPSFSSRVGSEVLAVDGKPMADFEREILEWADSAAPEGLHLAVAQALGVRVPALMPSPAVGTSTLVTFAKNGTTEDVALIWSKAPTARDTGPKDRCTAGIDMAPSSDYAGRAPEYVGLNFCVYATPNSATKIVRWFSFFYAYADFSGGDPGLEDFAPRLQDRLAETSFGIPDNELPLYPGETLPGGRLDEQAMLLLDHRHLIDHLTAKGAARVVFDVRENGGGSFDPKIISDFVASPFRQLTTQVVFGAGLKNDPALLDDGGFNAKRAKAYLKANPSASISPAYPFICSSATCGDEDLMISPPAPRLGAAVVVVTGPNCASSCDNFAVLMKDAAKAKIVGMPARAADSPVRVRFTARLGDEKSTATFVLTVAVNKRISGAVVEGTPVALDVAIFPSAATRGKLPEAVLGAVGW
jgi:hypothetical protein